MIYVNLGRTGIKVSRLCLGTMNFGPQADEKTSFDIMDKALEIGINFFDTANVYGWKLGEGVTERIIGKWLNQGGGRRQQIVLATKVYGKMGNNPNDQHLSAYHIIRACEDSLRRLQTDHIDLYQMHHVDRQTPWEEIWQAMDTLIHQGKIIYVGSSNFAGIHLFQCQAVAKEMRCLGLASEQSLYNLIDRTIELEVIPACRTLGIGLIPYSPLAGGILGGSNKTSIGRRASRYAQERFQEHKAKIDAYESYCKSLGEKPADIAIAWLLKNPVVTSPIIGPRTVEQLVDSLRSLEIKLPLKVMQSLNKIFPGPGDEAPEAYAW